MTSRQGKRRSAPPKPARPPAKSAARGGVAANRAQQKIETQQKVTEAARELFSELGFDATTTDAIAERAGVAKGTLFFHAKDKLDLLMLVMHDDLQATARRCLDHAPQKTPLLNQVSFVFDELVAMYLASPLRSQAFLTRLFLADGPHSERLHGLTFGFLGHLTTLVSAAQARGEVRMEVQADLAAFNLFSSYAMVLLRWATGQLDAAAVRPLIAEAITLQARGLLAP